MAAILASYFPPTRSQWQLFVKGFSIIPFLSPPLWIKPMVMMGKFQGKSILNINGRFGWCIMEIPTFICLWATFFGVKNQLGIETLPRMNYLMGSIFTIHYIYRSILSPLFLAPSVSPMHIANALSAVAFNVVNGVSIGGWLGGYGPTTNDFWSSRMIWVQLGIGLWLAGFAGNVYHDDVLRELRRSSVREQAAKAQAQGSKDKSSVSKVYKVPQDGLFQYILYPHYLCEWLEWTGFWILGGWTCIPARNFLANEISTMLPQAIQGKKWYIDKFGQEKIGDRKAIFPGIV